MIFFTFLRLLLTNYTTTQHMTDATHTFDDWDRRCEAMVRRLLHDEADHGNHLVSVLQGKKGDFGMCSRGQIRPPPPPPYERGCPDMQSKGWTTHVHTHTTSSQPPPPVVKTMIQQSSATRSAVTTKPKWCHFGSQCKYLRDVDTNVVHFKLFVHMCQDDGHCPFVADHLSGKPMTQAALRHFHAWKHQCPHGPYCPLHANSNSCRDHVLVFTHKTAKLS